MRSAFVGLVLMMSATAVGQEPIWVEGEAITSSNVKPSITGWGNKTFLSGETWLHYAIDADKVDKNVPAEGAVFSYTIPVTTAGSYTVWNRIGFEFARSPFEWRIDGGDWVRISPDVLTTDLMEIDFFCEVAWLKLDVRKLAKGNHTLEFRVTKTKDKDGKPERLLYASDAICLHPGEFHPNGRFKPGDDGRDDRDRLAAKTVFHLPAPDSAGARTSVDLNGLWEIARDDEQIPLEVAVPIASLPEHPFWRGIEVPGDKNTLRPDLVFAHRVWYRTRIDVPAPSAGRSFFLVFPQNNLNTTVYVNGQLCGFDKNPFARLQFDVTKAIKPGENVVMVGIRDAWYGRSADPANPMKLRKTFNLPLKFFSNGFQDLAYPIWNLPQSGILVTPSLVSAGPVYVEDVFVKTSVKNRRIESDLTLRNPSAAPRTATLGIEAIDAGGQVARQFPPREVTLAPGQSQAVTVSEPWSDATLWWPDNPTMYTLRTTLTLDGKTADVSRTPFGFREWSIAGIDFRLNGIPWHGWADTHKQDTPKTWLDFYRESNQTFMRFWGTDWMGMPPEKALSFFDRNGVVVRRSGILDGEAIGYHAVEQDPKIRRANGTDVKLDLLQNWRDQMVAQVKGERNHPSIMIWSIENEYLYINCINLHGGLMDQFEDEVVKTAEAVHKADPTRPTMTDGGGATKSNRMPVHGDHYTAGPFWEYPTLAYTANVKGGGRGRWEWDLKRPRFIGEELFAEGFNPKYSYFGGEEVFAGKAGSRRAVGLLVRMMTEGGRWTGNGAIHFWQTQNSAEGQYVANAPRAVFCRQWDWTFGSGQKVARTFGVFNDTHSAEPIAFTRTLMSDGKPLSTKTSTFSIPPGENQKFDDTLTMPEVSARTEAELVLSLTVAGKEVFRDVKDVSILPPPGGNPGIKPGELAVIFADDTLKQFLNARAIPFTIVTKDVPRTAKIVLVGSNLLSEVDSTSTAMASLALQGKRVIVLDQRTPLKYQALEPAEIEADTNVGRIAFIEDATHPAMKGLLSKDFFTWPRDEVVYRNAYLKPTKGARSIVQCHDQLRNSAMVEIPIGPGFLLVSQLQIGDSLDFNPVAKAVLENLLAHAATYKQEFREVVAVVDDSPELAEALEATGLKFRRESDPLQAIADTTAKIVVVNASPANLKALETHRDEVAAYKASGGYLVLNGLTPEGLASFNTLVGVDHMIRPFRRERVTFPPVREPLTAGLSLGDVALYSSEKIFPWQEGNYVASDTFSFVVDTNDVAPFAEVFDQNAFTANMVNGMVSADAWKYIVNLPAPAEGSMDFALNLPKPQAIQSVEWIGNTFYYPVTKFALVFDGQTTKTFDVKPNNDPQEFAFPPETGKTITLKLLEWDKIPGKNAVTGLDNIRLIAARSPEFLKKVRPMDSRGGLVHYPDGPGGIVLANVLYKSSEDVPANLDKKRAILATILRNLKAPFVSGRTVIAGATLDYQPVDLSKQANAFRTERGFFGDPSASFKDLPTGDQVFAGVKFNVYDFPTSPVPTIVMLGGSGIPGNLPSAVKGIPVGRKADALFFLQAARIDQRRNRDELRDNVRNPIARYVITYADGKTVDVPIVAEINVDNYTQKSPSALPGAVIAWTRPIAGKDASTVAYVQQWNNPRPDVAIKTVDLVGEDKPRGVPALIAITAATTRP